MLQLVEHGTYFTIKGQWASSSCISLRAKIKQIMHNFSDQLDSTNSITLGNLTNYKTGSHALQVTACQLPNLGAVAFDTNHIETIIQDGSG
jgi:hypothetical protein